MVDSEKKVEQQKEQPTFEQRSGLRELFETVFIDRFLFTDRWTPGSISRMPLRQI